MSRLVVACLCVVVGGALPAFGQKQTEQSTINDLCDRGVKAYRANDLRKACEMFEEAVSKHAYKDQSYINTLNSLLIVYEKLGDDDGCRTVKDLIAKYDRHPPINSRLSAPVVTTPSGTQQSKPKERVSAGLVTLISQGDEIYAEGSVKNNTDTYFSSVRVQAEVQYEDFGEHVESFYVDGLKPHARKSFKKRLFPQDGHVPTHVKIVRTTAADLYPE